MLKLGFYVLSFVLLHFLLLILKTLYNIVKTYLKCLVFTCNFNILGVKRFKNERTHEACLSVGHSLVVEAAESGARDVPSPLEPEVVEKAQARYWQVEGYCIPLQFAEDDPVDSLVRSDWEPNIKQM